MQMCLNVYNQRQTRVDLCHQPQLVFIRNTSGHFPQPALVKGFIVAENPDAQGCRRTLLRRMRSFRNSSQEHVKRNVERKQPVLPGLWWSPKKQNQNPRMTTIHAHVWYATNPSVTACRVKSGRNVLHAKCGHIQTVWR